MRSDLELMELARAHQYDVSKYLSERRDVRRLHKAAREQRRTARRAVAEARTTRPAMGNNVLF